VRGSEYPVVDRHVIGVRDDLIGERGEVGMRLLSGVEELHAPSGATLAILRRG